MRKKFSNQKLVAMARGSNTRAADRGRLADLRPVEVLFAFKHFGYRCAYCGESSAVTLDHFLPISKGGVSAIWNIVPACRECNLRKGATQPSDCVRLGLFRGDTIACVTDHLLSLVEGARQSLERA